MALVRWDPFAELGDIQREINRLFASRYGDEAEQAARTFRPAVDIEEHEDAIVIHADLPGVAKKDIDVRVDGNTLTIKAERSSEAESSDKTVHRRERFYGLFQRSFTLPDNVDASELKARYDNGVLTLNLPKRPEAKPRSVKVE